jgi:hypothetical protein
VKRHPYKKHPDRDAICECGQGRAEDVHRMMVWRKARTGNWLSDTTREGVYRCRYMGNKWIPEVGQNPDWLSLDGALTLAEAKAVCERHREEQ